MEGVETDPRWIVVDGQGQVMDPVKVTQVIKPTPRGEAVSVTIPGATSAGGALKEVRRLLSEWVRQTWWTQQEEEVAISCCREANGLRAHWVVLRNLAPPNAAQLLYRTGSATGYRPDSPHTWIARQWTVTPEALPLVAWVDLPQGCTAKQGVKKLWDSLASVGVNHGGIFVTGQSAHVGRAGVRIRKNLPASEAKKLKEWAAKQEGRMGLPSASAWAAQGYGQAAGIALGVRQHVKFRQIPVWYAEQAGDGEVAQQLLNALGGRGKVEDVRTLPRLISKEPNVDLSCTVLGEDCLAMAEKGKTNGNGNVQYIQVPCPENIPKELQGMWPGTVQFVWNLPGATPQPRRGQPTEKLSTTYASVPKQSEQPGKTEGQGQALPTKDKGSYSDVVRKGKKPHAKQQRQQGEATEGSIPSREGNADTIMTRSGGVDVNNDNSLERRLAALEQRMADMCAILTRELENPHFTSRARGRPETPSRGRSAANTADTADNRSHSASRTPSNSTNRTPSRHTGTASAQAAEHRKAADTERAYRAQALRDAKIERDLRLEAERQLKNVRDHVEDLTQKMKKMEEQLSEFRKLALANTRDPMVAAASPAGHPPSQTASPKKQKEEHEQ
jgi:hypothetical protein